MIDRKISVHLQDFPDVSFLADEVKNILEKSGEKVFVIVELVSA